jgi:UDP-N-acetylglucosamine 2-epimerase (non-hydrolysing)
VPEETNRKIVDHISDINLTYSDIAREYLLREGLSPDRVIKTGSPMFEVLHYYLPQIKKSDVLKRLNLEMGKYFVVSAHREENISNDLTFFGLLEVLNRIAETYEYPVIVSTHPRTRKRLEQLNQLESASSKFYLNKLIQWQKPLSFSDYNALQLHAHTVLSDSGTISEESSILNFRALNIRETHERPEAMEEASVMMVGLEPERIMLGLQHLQNQNTSAREQTPVTSDSSLVSLRPVSDYGMPNVSEKVVRIILSYTDYINRVVWKKN